MAEERLPKIALKWMPKQKRAGGRPKKNWMEGIKKAMNERNLNEGQWEDRKQWSLVVGQRRKTFSTRYVHVHTYTYNFSKEQYVLPEDDLRIETCRSILSVLMYKNILHCYNITVHSLVCNKLSPKSTVQQ